MTYPNDNAQYFHAKSARCSIVDSNGTGHVVAILQNIEIKVADEHKELRGNDKIVYEDIVITNRSISLSVEAAKFNPEFLGILISNNVDEVAVGAETGVLIKDGGGAGEIGDVTIAGSGYTGTTPKRFYCKLTDDTVGANKFRYSVDNLSWSEELTCANAAVTLQDGVTVNWGTADPHVDDAWEEGDYFYFDVNPQLLDLIDDDGDSTTDDLYARIDPRGYVPQKFTITATVTSSGPSSVGNKYMRAILNNVVFKDFPVIKSGSDDWMTVNISGVSNDLILKVQDATYTPT